MVDIVRAVVKSGQTREGFNDGYSGNSPSLLRTSSLLAEELVEAYWVAYRAGQDAKRNNELSKK